MTSVVKLVRRFGPAFTTFALAAAAFALLWFVSPNLSADSTSSGTISGLGDRVTTTQAPIVTTTAGPTTSTTVGVERIAVANPSIEEEAALWERMTESMVFPPDWPESLVPTGDLSLRVYSSWGDVTFTEGTVVEWFVEVTNISETRRWAPYAYIERFGPAPCDERLLEAGESTTCSVSGTVYEGERTVDAWATAWSIEAVMSTERLLLPYTVTR